MEKLIIIFLICFVLPIESLSQTCCSGGVPVSNSMGLSIKEDSKVVFGLSFDHHNLSSIYDQNEVTEVNSRKRVTESYLFQIGTRVKAFNLEALVPYINQKREINSFIGEDFESSNGIGDAAFLIGRDFGGNKNWQVSTGLKMPTGEIVNESKNSIRLNADMQSGTGSWDGIFLFKHFRQLRNNTFYLQGFNTLRGTKREYEEQLDYKFGNESQLILGWIKQVVLLSQIFDFGIATRYRLVGENKANGQIVPSTGGQWLLANVFSRLYVRNGQTSIAFNVDVPYWVKVNGLQNVPTYRMNFSIFNELRVKEK